MSASQTVFQFDDGDVILAFDAERDERSNAILAKALSAAGKRKMKSGGSDVGKLRPRMEGDQITDDVDW